MSTHALHHAAEWTDAPETIPCANDPRYESPELTHPRATQERHELAKRCVTECPLYALCDDYAQQDYHRWTSVIVAGRYYQQSPLGVRAGTVPPVTKEVVL